jgi:rhodanese-related sulfurtransferase
MSFLKNVACIILLSVIVAVLYNNFSGRGIPWFAKVSTEGPRPRLILSDSAAAIKYIELPEARAQYESGVTFVDARKGEEYEAGHIKGALSVPADAAPEAIAVALKSLPKDAGLIVYCDGEECGASTTLAGKLQRLGYSKVQVFFNGWTVWLGAKLPTVKGGKSQ